MLRVGGFTVIERIGIGMSARRSGANTGSTANRPR